MTMEEQAIEQAARDAYASYANDPVKKHLFIPKVSAYVTGVKSQKAKEFHTKGMYSEEEVMEIINQIDDLYRPYHRNNILGWEWFEQNKKR